MSLDTSAGQRRGQSFMPDAPLYGLEQEYSLELPLDYPVVTAPTRIAVLLHAFHVDLLPEFRAYLEHIPAPADLFISTDTDTKRAAISACFARWGKGSLEIQVMPNRGRDVAPKIVGFAAVHRRYDYVLHLHTKSSPHDSRLVGWRGYLLDTLLGSPAVVRSVLDVFARAPRLGMVAPQHIDELRPWIRWGDNHALAEGLAARMGFALPRTAPLDFPSGSMFWARSAALRPLLDLQLGVDDFPLEMGQTDGTLAHAIERLYFLVCEHAGFEWLKVTARGELHEQSGVVAVSNPQELDRFLARHRLSLASLRDQTRPFGIDPVITSPPPKPRRVLHVTWRAALGDDAQVPTGRRFVIALHGEAASAVLVRSIEIALRQLPAGVDGQMLSLASASRAAALQAGFEAGADLVLAIGAPGLLHPQSGDALLRMSEAQAGRALMEVAGASWGTRTVDRNDFSIASATGPAVAVPRVVHDAVGGYATALAGEAADQEYARRARMHGFDVLLCPRAFFAAAAVSAATRECRVA